MRLIYFSTMLCDMHFIVDRYAGLGMVAGLIGNGGSDEASQANGFAGRIDR